jgi:hypothetical protein
LNGEIAISPHFLMQLNNNYCIINCSGPPESHYNELVKNMRTAIK